jgi:hypothetical protein
MHNHADELKLYGWFPLIGGFQLARARASHAHWTHEATGGVTLERWLIKLN